MNKREIKMTFLLSYSRMKERILILTERRRAYEDDCYGIKAVTYSGTPKGSDVVDLSNKVSKLLSLTEDIDNEIRELTGKMEYINTVIHTRLKNYRLISVLELKYIDGLQRKQIAQIMDCSVQKVDNLTAKAIMVIEIKETDLKKVL